MAETYEPSGPDAVVLQKLRRMVALSPTFQSRVTPDDYEAAYGRGHYRFADAGERPQAFFGSSAVHWGLIAGGAQNFLWPHGTLGLLLEVDPNPEMEDKNDQELDALDWMAKVMADVAELAAADDPDSETSHLDITQISFLEWGSPPEITVASSGNWFWGIWSIDWGTRN